MCICVDACVRPNATFYVEKDIQPPFFTIFIVTSLGLRLQLSQSTKILLKIEET